MSDVYRQFDRGGDAYLQMSINTGTYLQVIFTTANVSHNRPRAQLKKKNYKIDADYISTVLVFVYSSGIKS